MKTNTYENKVLRNFIILGTVSVGVYALLISLMFAGVINEYLARLITLAGIYAIVSLGLNLISGFAGQLALGHAGFMSIGAYTTATLIMKVFPANIPGMIISILIGGVFAAIAGFIIGLPALRLRGDYLAIVTLAFCIVIRVIMVNLESITGGAAGLKGVPSFSYAPDYTVAYVTKFTWIFIFLIIAIVMLKNFIDSSHGRALVAIRENEVAANSMGINTSFYKVSAFVASAAFGGVAGGLYAILNGYINPMMFDWMKSIDFVVVVVLGGLGSITGTLIASVIVVFLQELPNFPGLEFLVDWRMVIYSLLLVLLMRFRPKGIMGRTELSIVGLFDKATAFARSRYKGGEGK